MAIIKNREFEELSGVKCGIVEKEVKPDRVQFLKELPEYNKYAVVIVPSPPLKVAPAPVVKSAEGTETLPPLPPPRIKSFTVEAWKDNEWKKLPKPLPLAIKEF